MYRTTTLALGLALVPVGSGPQASPCCAGSTTPGFEHLALWETLAGGARLGVDHGLGAWDADGRWRPHEDYAETLVRAELWTVARPAESWQLGVRVPYLHTWRRAGDAEDDGGGLGDVAASVRLDAFPGGEGPAGLGVALVLGVVAPTGQETETASGALAADVTGEGHWVPSLGCVLMRPWDTLFLRAQANVGVPLTRRVGGHESRRGVDVQSALVGGWSPFVPTTLSLSLGHRWQAESVRDGRVVPDSGRGALNVALGVAQDLPDPLDSLALQATLTAPLPVDGAGRGTLAGVGGTLGVRIGWP